MSNKLLETIQAYMREGGPGSGIKGHVTLRPEKMIDGIKKGQDGVWRYKTGKPVSSDHGDRIKALAIPPAWKNVSLSDDPNSALQATGIDAKGRMQYRYSAAHSEAAAAEKFHRLQDFNKALPNIRNGIDKDLSDPKSANHETAMCLHLIDKTGFRIGSERDTRAKEKAFGASTLTSDHVSVQGDIIRFKFTGKKGVMQEHSLTDRHLAEFVRNRKGKLFNTTDEKVRDYLKNVSGDDFKVKDFRTYRGISLALSEIKKSPVAKSQKEFKKLQNSIAKRVASFLGNTPSMALKAYIDPAVWHRSKKYV